MQNEPNHDITLFIQQLRSDDPQLRTNAQEALFSKYSDDLRTIAMGQLGKRFDRRGVEPQAIGDSALRTFLMRPRVDIIDRRSLWRFLTRLVINKAIQARRHEFAAKRDMRKEHVFADDEDSGIDRVDPKLDRKRRGQAGKDLKRPYYHNVDVGALRDADDDEFMDQHALEILKYGVMPSEAGDVIEMFEGLQPKFQEIAALKIECGDDAEVAKRLNVSRRTVTRAIQAIKEAWKTCCHKSNASSE